MSIIGHNNVMVLNVSCKMKTLFHTYYIFLLWGFFYGVRICAPLNTNLDVKRVVYQSFVLNENTIQCYGVCEEYRDSENKNSNTLKFGNSQCEGNNLKVRCKRGYHVNVISGVSGILNPDLDICNAMTSLRCLRNVTRAVSKICNLATICTLDVGNHAMMEGCSDTTYWSMDVRYRCNRIASVRTTRRIIDHSDSHGIENTKEMFAKKSLTPIPFDSITILSKRNGDKYIRKTKPWFLIAYNTITTNEFIKKKKTQLLIILFITIIFSLILWTCCFYESCKSTMNIGRNFSQVFLKPHTDKVEVLPQVDMHERKENRKTCQHLPTETVPVHKASSILYTQNYREGDDSSHDVFGSEDVDHTCIHDTTPEPFSISDKSIGSLSCLPTETSMSSNDEKVHNDNQYYYPRHHCIHKYKTPNGITTGSVKSCDMINSCKSNGLIRNKRYREKYRSVKCGRKKKTRRRGTESGYQSRETTTDCSGGLSTDEEEWGQFIPERKIRSVTKSCHSMPCHLYSHCAHHCCPEMTPLKRNNQCMLEHSAVPLPTSCHYGVKSCERDLSCLHTQVPKSSF